MKNKQHRRSDCPINFALETFGDMWSLLIIRDIVHFGKKIYGEFSKVSINSINIGQIARTKKPIITNDVINDPRIKYPEWAKREKLQSFAGYPLLHKGEIIGVVAMFSEKKLSPAQFEMLGIFCDHISKEISMLYDIGEFLSIR